MSTSSNPLPSSSADSSVVVGEVEDRQPCRCLGGVLGARLLDRLEEDAVQPRPRGHVPDRQRRPAARPEHTGELGCGTFGTPHVQEPEPADGGVERCVRERQGLRVAAHERALRVPLGGELDHRVGDVDSDDPGAAARSGAGDDPGPVATSSTSVPAWTPAASSSGSANVAVTRAM